MYMCEIDLKSICACTYTDDALRRSQRGRRFENRTVTGQDFWMKSDVTLGVYVYLWAMCKTTWCPLMSSFTRERYV